MNESGLGPQQIDRQMTILELATAHPEGLYLSEIADSAGLPRPTVHRMVDGLIRAGLLSPRGSGRKAYVPGPRLLRLLHGGLPASQVQAIAEPVLRDLVATFGETAFLARLMGTEIVSVAMVAPDRPWRGFVDPGHKFIAHAAASAKAILAFQTPAVIDRMLTPPLEALTPFTLTDPDAVRRDFALVRANGHAVCDREISLDLLAYACPVMLPNLGVLYSLALTGPLRDMQRMEAGHIITALNRGAERLAAILARWTRHSPEG